MILNDYITINFSHDSKSEYACIHFWYLSGFCCWLVTGRWTVVKAFFCRSYWLLSSQNACMEPAKELSRGERAPYCHNIAGGDLRCTWCRDLG